MSILDNVKSNIKGNKPLEKIYLMIKHIGIRYFYNWTLKKKFKDACGYDLNLKNPKTFSEKIQWIKVNVRDSKMTKCADKIRVREYIKEKIGDGYLPKVYEVWENEDEISFENLPEKFVLKSNHGSGQVIIVKNKQQFDEKKAKEILGKWLKENYYYKTGEWVYKDIKPLVYAEELLDEDIVDYKFFCFNGEPKFLYVSSGFGGEHDDVEMIYMDMKWNPLEMQREDYKVMSNIPNKPEAFEKMIEVSKILSTEFNFVRVDLYYLQKKGIIFSELTFYPNGGFSKYRPIKWEYKMGEWLNLNKN